MANVSTLEEAAMSGDINKLYEAIQQDPRILEDVDAVPFVDTPMHIAARAGHVEFAIEIMRLKPSFALKLNQQGFSPIHIALQNNHHYMVKRLVYINTDLVRVQAREGLTPLHVVCQSEENVELLIEFLQACPGSIKDLNVRRETALHIALRYGNFRAFRVLVGWLQRNTLKGARLLQYYISDRKDLAGNTILHLSALAGNRQAVDLLINSRLIYINAKNLEGKTALDLAGDFPEIQRILLNAGARDGASIPYLNYEGQLKSKITVPRKIATFVSRMRSNISAEQRDAYMVVAALIITAIYQSALSPPGGLYQADNGANNLTMNATSSLNFTDTAAPGKAGESILSASDFITITGLNTGILVLTLMTILFLTPRGWVGLFLVAPTILFTISYLSSVASISPTTAGIDVFSITAIIFIGIHLFWMVGDTMLPSAEEIECFKISL